MFLTITVQEATSKIPLRLSRLHRRSEWRRESKSRCRSFCSVLHNYKGDVNDSYFHAPAHSCEGDDGGTEEFSMTHPASSFLQKVGCVAL